MEDRREVGASGLEIDFSALAAVCVVVFSP